jgi:hypothetical protein
MRIYGAEPGGRVEDDRRDVHGIVDGRGEAACGLKDLVPLHEPPRAWQSEPALRHCPVCVAALATEVDLGRGPRVTPTNIAR